MRDLAFELEATNPEEARKTWEEILRLQPENAAYKKEYAEFLIANDDPDYGYELLQELPDDATRAFRRFARPVVSAAIPRAPNRLKKHSKRKTLQTGASRFSAESDNPKAARAFETKNIRPPAVSLESAG